mmetsp:Transcript_11968/g.34146  ORF Transcript_11968/g.34146 Transcript_11968/m.34146 type:complete len:215 (+) Transcript_11968:2368-3012(+)
MTPAARRRRRQRAASAATRAARARTAASAASASSPLAPGSRSRRRRPHRPRRRRGRRPTGGSPRAACMSRYPSTPRPCKMPPRRPPCCFSSGRPAAPWRAPRSRSSRVSTACAATAASSPSPSAARTSSWPTPRASSRCRRAVGWRRSTSPENSPVSCRSRATAARCETERPAARRAGRAPPAAPGASTPGLQRPPTPGRKSASGTLRAKSTRP